MTSRRDTIIQWASLLAGSFIILQIYFILAKGEALCFNDGCRVVDKLTTIPPLYINLAGLLYFVVLFFAGSRTKAGPHAGLDLTRLLLLLGLAVEGILLSYQIFVIRTLCSYCLGIFTIIVLLNLLCGWQQIRLGLPLFGAVLATFALLNFNPAALIALRSDTLAAGTYAVKRCSVPAKKLYFFFSAECPHCKNVLAVLENCNSCEFHFNPIDKDQTISIQELEFAPAYNPSLNRVVLSLLDITTIPVLLVQNPDGLTFIKGEEAIIRFVREACFMKAEESPDTPPSLENLGTTDLYDEQEGECAIEVECPDTPPESTQSPYSP